MQRYWTKFVKTGDPNGEGLTAWPRYNNTHRPYVEFSTEGVLKKENLRRPYCELFTQWLKRQMPE